MSAVLPANITTPQVSQPANKQTITPNIDKKDFADIVAGSKALAKAQLIKNTTQAKTGTEIAPKEVAREFVNSFMGQMWQIIVAEARDSSGMNHSVGEKTFSEVLAGKRFENSTQFEQLTDQVMRELDPHGIMEERGDDEHISEQVQKAKRQSEL